MWLKHGFKWIKKRPAIWLGLAALGVSLVWLTTLQTQMGTAVVPPPHPLVGLLMDDSGEFVVAWHRWGVAHPPGYPLLNLVANFLTRLFALFFVPPVAAASLVSWVFGLAALTVLASLVWQQGGRFAAAATLLLPAFGGLTWLYSSVAEVYSLGLLLGTLMLLLALSLGREPTRPKAIALGLVCGLAFGHHRTLLLLLPAVLLAIWPIRRLSWRTWMLAGGVALLSLLIYAYLPLAAASGSPWVYGRSPDTWAGFMDAVLAREYSTQVTPPLSLELLREAFYWRVYFLIEELGWPGFLAGCFGLGLALWQRTTRRAAAVLLLVALCYWLAPVGTYLLIGTHLPVMITSFALAGGWGLGLTAVGQTFHPGWQRAGLILTVVIVGWLGWRNWPQVVLHTHDDTGQQLIAAAAQLPDPAPMLVETWGPRFFALAAGKWVTGELAAAQLVDARHRLEGLPTTLSATLYTTPLLLYQNPPPMWAEQLNRPITIESAGYGLVAVTTGPRLTTLPQTNDQEIQLHTAHAWRDGPFILVTVEWLALQKPSVDYHVFVHLTDQAEISGPDDIIAQGDQQNPVYGFSPTTAWVAGQLVRDDYRVVIPDTRQPTQLFIGLYTTTEDGGFVNVLRQAVPLTAEPR